MKVRYYAKEINGKGYIFDREFSERVPIAVEKTIEEAENAAQRYNARRDYD